MPRSLVLGNGQILVCLDEKARLRDFYFRYVGLENQMYKNCVAKIGVWVEGSFSWLDSYGWKIDIDYKDQTMVGTFQAVNQELQLEIVSTDVVYNEKNIFIRKFEVKNKANYARNIKIYFSNQFHLHANKTGNTAYFDPEDNTIVHYKGRRVIVIGGKIDDGSFTQYSVGVFGIEGKEGTYKDAEDGELARNPVEHGPADSVIGFESHADADSSFDCYLWYSAAVSLKEAKLLYQSVLSKGPEHFIQSSHDFWKAWVNKMALPSADLDAELLELYKKSLLIIRTHVDNNGGIIASGDSDMLQLGKDTYSYVWPRDAAFICMALDKANYSEVSRVFFKFCNEVISDEGYFYHKYQPDKSVGSSWHPWILNGERSLPIQEDETALVLYALWYHYQKTRDIEFIESIYNSLIKKAANFMLGFRDGITKLPLPTYDLWEMKNGTSTYTSASVYAALIAASNFAILLGKTRDAYDYTSGALEIKKAIELYLWNDELKCFYKNITRNDDQILHDTTIDLSSFYGLYKFGILDPLNPRLIQTFQKSKEALAVRGRGGYARFEGDVYYQPTPINPGNPWFITTLWVAQYQISIASKLTDLTVPHDALLWVAKHAKESGILSEQIDLESGSDVSASPLIWSHAEYVTTVLEYIEKYNQLSK